MKRYEDLSEKEKQALIETCKDDPVIFIETVLEHKLFDYQKVYIREIFKACGKPEAPDFITKCFNKPVDELATTDCPVCGSVFSYGKNDIHIRKGFKLGCVRCPKCEANLVIDGLKFSWM